MLGRFLPAKTIRSNPHDGGAVRELRAQLCKVRGQVGGELTDALVRAAARAQDAATFVALVHERLVDLSRPEMLHLADTLQRHDGAAAEQLRTMAAQCESLQPTALRRGDMLVTLWKNQGVAPKDSVEHTIFGVRKGRTQADALLAQALKARSLADLVFPGCRIPPQGAHILASDAPSDVPAMHMYRSLLLRPDLMAQIPFAAFQGRVQHTGAALLGASLQHGDAAWRARLLDLLQASPSVDLVAALLPHGDMLRPLCEQGVRWIDWLVLLRPMWQASAAQASAALHDKSDTMGMETALAWAACVAAASCDVGGSGANIAVLINELPVVGRHTVIEALLETPALRAQLHAKGIFEATQLAQHGLACMGAAMALPESAAQIYREFRGSRKSAYQAAPEVALWLSCLSCAGEQTSKAELLRLLEMGAGQLETLEKEHPALRNRLIEQLGDVACESPLVNAFADTSTRAIILAGPNKQLGNSRLQQACIKHLRETLASGAPARRAQRLFAGLSHEPLEGLREAICEAPESLLWPLYKAGIENRHVLRTGLPLIDYAVASVGSARHVLESLSATALPAVAAVNATHLALLIQQGASGMWSRSLQSLEDDALLLAVAGLGTSSFADALQVGHGAWALPEHLRRSAELAPQMWRIIQSEDGSHGKLTDLVPHDVGRVVRLFVDAPSLLRHAIDRLGQQPTRVFEDVIEDEDGMVELESVGDFLEEALRRVRSLTDALPSLANLLNAQRLTDISVALPEGDTWSSLAESQVRRTAQTCQWLGGLQLQSETPRVAALRRRDAVDHARRRRPGYDALAFATPAQPDVPLHAAADMSEMAPAICRDLGHIHSFGLMPLPRKPNEAMTFGARSIQAPQNLHSLQELHAVAEQSDQISYPERWSKCVQALLADVVAEIACWARQEKLAAPALQRILVASLSQYLSGFTSLPESTSRKFCERALPWAYLMPHLPERPADPALSRALQLVADFAVLLRLT